jgi:hypothetical protein
LQGRLSVDYDGLQVLTLTALQKVAADSEALQQAQTAMQLAVMGRLQELAAVVQELQAGTASDSDSTSTAMLREVSSLAQLTAGDDVDMTSSSGEEEEEEEEQGGDELPAGKLAGLSPEQAAAWLMDGLGEQAGAHGAYKVRVDGAGWEGGRAADCIDAGALGLRVPLFPADRSRCIVHSIPQDLVCKLSLGALWECYQAAISGPPEMVAGGSRPRTRGGQFIRLAKARAAAEKSRWGDSALRVHGSACAAPACLPSCLPACAARTLTALFPSVPLRLRAAGSGARRRAWSRCSCAPTSSAWRRRRRLARTSSWWPSLAAARRRWRWRTLCTCWRPIQTRAWSSWRPPWRWCRSRPVRRWELGGAALDGAGQGRAACMHAPGLQGRLQLPCPTGGPRPLPPRAAAAFYAAPAFSSNKLRVDHRSRDNPLAPAGWALALKVRACVQGEGADEAPM